MKFVKDNKMLCICLAGKIVMQKLLTAKQGKIKHFTFLCCTFFSLNNLSLCLAMMMAMMGEKNNNSNTVAIK